MGASIEVTVVAIHNGKVKLAFTGPREIPIDRLEVRAAKNAAMESGDTELEDA